MNDQERGAVKKMTVEELALLCGLLSKHFAMASEDMKGFVETCFFSAWTVGVTKTGSTLEFYDLVSELDTDFAKLREGIS